MHMHMDTPRPGHARLSSAVSGTRCATTITVPSSHLDIIMHRVSCRVFAPCYATRHQPAKPHVPSFMARANTSSSACSCTCPPRPRPRPLPLNPPCPIQACTPAPHTALFPALASWPSLSPSSSSSSPHSHSHPHTPHGGYAYSISTLLAYILILHPPDNPCSFNATKQKIEREREGEKERNKRGREKKRKEK